MQTVPIQVRFADLDLLGHVNNVTYFVYLETARVAFILELEEALFGSFLVARSECDYLAPIEGETREVAVDVTVERIGRSSIVLAQDIRVGDTVHARGRTVLVTVGDDGRPRPVTDAERRCLEVHAT